ncbi:O-antigen ligase family protein [Thermoflavifilum thermophilum]|uniref:O-antigen ligase-related domain-containing protein n=1 Tax=Thermoflavifilum thermophilum TaxID=1393122 RepID=A0A1I7NE92_9BACT|nr:O-antigen ligase family protein [Thermoflavifilum thermophilum]SFV32961.1 hypothetical protein SAMN05660895_1512 [Thermoflavifilum thermophilum]
MITANKIYHKKQYTSIIISVLLLAVVLISYAYSLSLQTGGLLFLVIVSLIVLFISIAYPGIAYYLDILYGFLTYFFIRLLNLSIPVSTGGEFLTGAIFVGIILRKIIHHERLWHHIHNPFTYAYVIILIYFGLEAFNPNAYPPVGWMKIYPVTVMGFVFYLISLYLFKTEKEIYFFIKFWIIIAFLVALYGCMQQWLGLPPWEYRRLMSDPHTFGILFQGGFIRKYSTLSDPAAFGVFLSGTIVFCISILLMKLSVKKSALLIIAIIFMLLGMSYSGTRTATAVIPFGIIFLGLLTIQNRKTLIVIGGVLLIGTALILSPLQNGVLNRVRSAFHPSQDPSMIVRDLNRRSKQSYMHHHPIGGGIKTTGFEALELYPHHPLAGFPPDSVFVQNALEIGWIGFIIQLITYFIVLKFAIHQYYHQPSHRHKIIFAGFAAALFTWFLSDYSQGAISNFSISFIYNGILAAMIKLKYIQSEKNII